MPRHLFRQQHALERINPVPGALQIGDMIRILPSCQMVSAARFGVTGIVMLVPALPLGLFGVCGLSRPTDVKNHRSVAWSYVPPDAGVWLAGEDIEVID
jgi:hypothetical protein